MGYSSWGHRVGHDWATNTLESLWLKSGSFLSSCVSLFPIFPPHRFLLPPFLSLPSFPSYFFLFSFLLLSSLFPASSFFPSLSFTLLSPCYVHGSNRVGQTPSWFKSSPAQVKERSSERPDDLPSLCPADWEAKPGIPAFLLPRWADAQRKWITHQIIPWLKIKPSTFPLISNSAYEGWREREKEERERKSVRWCQPDPTTSQPTKPLHPKEPALVSREEPQIQGSISLTCFQLFKKSFFFFLKIYLLFIYFWLCWVFIAARGELVAALRLCQAGATFQLQCAGFSLQWFLLLQSTWLCNVPGLW